jgi:hypothetical protein
MTADDLLKDVGLALEEAPVGLELDMNDLADEGQEEAPETYVTESAPPADLKAQQVEALSDALVDELGRVIESFKTMQQTIIALRDAVLRPDDELEEDRNQDEDERPVEDDYRDADS